MRLTKVQLMREGAVFIYYGYCLAISNMQDFQQYAAELESEYKIGLQDAIDRKKDLISASIGSAIGAAVHCDPSFTSVAEKFIKITNQTLFDKIEAIKKYGKIYVHANLTTYMPATERFVETGESVFIDRLSDWPIDFETIPRVLRVAANTYSIKCGNNIVSVDGQTTWPSPNFARQAFQQMQRAQQLNSALQLL